MSIVSDYFAAEKALLEYFSYEPPARILPYWDATDMYWYINCRSVYFAESRRGLNPKKHDRYLGNYSILHNMDSLKPGGAHIYRGEEYTLIGLDMQSYGSFFLYVFDNSKEVTAQQPDTEQEPR
jgi:hypothetical protein